MIESHPFPPFVPKNTQYLLLGSFTGRRNPKLDNEELYDWFYGTKRNQFWLILEEVYGVKLQNKIEKQELFSKLSLAITDIILSCERKENNNLDNNLINCVFNTKAITQILESNKINSIFFSSRFVEGLFKKHFKSLIDKYPQITLTTLPSPSPRFAAMSRAEKVVRYKELLPKIND